MNLGGGSSHANTRINVAFMLLNLNVIVTESNRSDAQPVTEVTELACQCRNTNNTWTCVPWNHVSRESRMYPAHDTNPRVISRMLLSPESVLTRCQECKDRIALAQGTEMAQISKKII